VSVHKFPGAGRSRRLSAKRTAGNTHKTVNDPMPDEPRTELGYAHRLIHVYGDRLRYVPVWRRWLVWDGQTLGP
jgi:hypothetical protein